MKSKSLSYKGSEIKMMQEESVEYFTGCYVKTFWFPDLDKAKAFIDKMYFGQEMNS